MVYAENLRLPPNPVLNIRAGLRDYGMLRLFNDAACRLEASISPTHDAGGRHMLAGPLKLDPSRRMLHPQYEDLFQVLERQDHSFKLNVRDGPKWVSLWRLKAFAKPWALQKGKRQVRLPLLVGSRSGLLH